jgi:hypothetical protein
MNLLKPAQAVIYTSDMEPITVIDMKPWYWEFLYRHTMINLAIVDSTRLSNDADFIYQQPRYISVYADILYRSNEMFMLLRVEDEVTALLLEPGILPGQRRMFNEEKKKAFARGVIEALMMGCGD